jgi:tetratricopeptide (TPR) repeat protein
MSEFHTTQPPLTKFRVDYLRLALLSILFLTLPVLFIISVAVSFDHDLILILPFVVVPLGISIYRAILFVINMDLEILVFNDGFTYTKRGETRKYFWKEIDKVWTTRFELISIIYIKYIKVKIIDASGNTLILDRTLQKVDKFEAIVQEQVARDKFPQALTMLQRGMNLEFGEITITKDYIKNSHDTIRWSELGDLQTWQGTIRLWKKGKKEISIISSIPSIPNFTLLISLIGHLSKNAQTTPLPLQEIKKERNMSPEKLQQAIALVKSGDKESGQKLLFEIVSQDPDNETAWLWLVDVVSPDKRIFCLEKALNINPNNVQVKQYLEKLKASEPGEPIKSKTKSRIKPGGNTDARLSGLFILILGAGLGYWQILLPIKKALQYEENISYFSEAAILVPIAIFMGLFLIIFGSEGYGFLSKPSSKLGFVLFLIGIIVFVLGCYFGMQFIMKGLGYY